MPNRLARTNSPYLLQHADNPVDWWPWGEEAFAEAKRRDVPVFLSIGYATCHWCHVMEHESFEDEATARLLNEAFVCVKVDREERPDVDAIYMSVCQAMNGHGGWPLTLLLTPDAEPFFAGTYLPRESRPGRVGLLDFVPRVSALWQAEREGVVGSAASITAALREANAPAEPTDDGLPGTETLDLGYRQLRGRFDAEHGGFGRAPKFPTPHTLLFLLRQGRRTGAGAALSMVEKTLRAMRRGGLWDHVGLGFHRYATDERWLLPHFEKMLYDQALLAMAYTDAARATGDPWYRTVAEGIFQYVERDLTSPEGAFFCAEDADSLNAEGHREEGAFYVWTEDELRDALGPDDAAFARAVFGTQPEGNFEDEATRRRTGANVLHHPEPLADLAEQMGTGEGALRDRVEAVRLRLFDARAARPRPLLDDKVLTDWNGLMIAALARAARAFGDRELAARAARAARFLLATMRDSEGRLLHRYRNGEAAIPGLLDDYTHLAWGLFELYQATFEEDFLRDSLLLHRATMDRFGDEVAGGLFLTPADGEPLLVRPKEWHDGAIPSGNAVALFNGLRLGRLTGDAALERQAERIAAAVPTLRAYPEHHSFFLTGVDFLVGPTQEVVVAGERGADDTHEMMDRLGRFYAPNAIVLGRLPGEGPAPITELAPFTEAQTARSGKATAYVCERQTCQAPTTDPGEAARQLALGYGKS